MIFKSPILKVQSVQAEYVMSLTGSHVFDGKNVEEELDI